MSEFDADGENDQFTLKDFKRLLKLNLWCKSEDKLERARLRSNALKWILNPVLSMLGWLSAVLLVISGLIPPYVSLQFALAAVGLFGMIILSPRIARFYHNRFNGWGLIYIKAFVVISMTITAAFYPVVSQLKKNVVTENEQERIRLMNPSERFQYEEVRVNEARRTEEKEAREKIERAAKEWDVTQVAKEKEASLNQQVAVRENNKEQRVFYSDLGSPKILYRCNNSDVEKAVGAKIGNINLLLSDAQQDCGSGGYEILKRKE